MTKQELRERIKQFAVEVGRQTFLLPYNIL